ncbi:hypothetical protein P7K49_036521 [Saguinus oedipus]|uniref:Uncharacterized protein n=1 Tax=Saguinus oedipus TaxID=9490 RepID=A0ABQ9TKM2_SAGOE|nr:hypothetical protein P7K49_036521 [Saguinus oedipus]
MAGLSGPAGGWEAGPPGTAPPARRCFKKLLRGSERGRSRSPNKRTEPTGQVHGCGDSGGMTGHHGWGYGQDDGRRRPPPPPPARTPTQLHSPQPSRPSRFPGPASSHPPGWTGTPLPSWSPNSAQALVPRANRKVRAAPRVVPPPATCPAAESCRLLCEAPDCPARSDPGPDSHSPRACAARGAGAAERCARVSVRGARTAGVRGLRGIGAPRGKGAVSPGESFPAEVAELPSWLVPEGRGHMGAQACLAVCTERVFAHPVAHTSLLG